MSCFITSGELGNGLAKTRVRARVFNSSRYPVRLSTSLWGVLLQDAGGSGGCVCVLAGLCWGERRVNGKTGRFLHRTRFFVSQACVFSWKRVVGRGFELLRQQVQAREKCRGSSSERDLLI